MFHPVTKNRATAVTLLLAALCGGQVCEVAAAAVNYDTAWTFVYDGGRDSRTGRALQDKLSDVKALPNGMCVCVGGSNAKSLLITLDSRGAVVKKLLYTTTNTEQSYYNSQTAHAVAIAGNGDYLVGGERYSSPWIMRLDTSGSVKWSTWYYDSTKGVLGRLLNQSATINSLRETRRGTIICAAGDEYPNNGGARLNNYGVIMEFSAAGKVTTGSQWNNEVGYKIGGFYVEEGSNGNYFLSGNQTVIYLDTGCVEIWKKAYTFSLPDVGTVTNNVMRVKMLRDGTLMAAGQAYEGNCWTHWQKFYYDAWHSPISYAYGLNASWDTAGVQGADDIIYDFTQLVNGNLVFVGSNGNFATGGVWVFVTDPTGRNLLWEKNFRIPYRNADGRSPDPRSVCATADSGFTVVGEYSCNDSNGGMNGFAAHFIAKTVGAVPQVKLLHSGSNGFRCRAIGSKMVFTLPQTIKTSVTITLYRANGRMIKKLTSENTVGDDRTISLDVSNAGKGLYVYAVNAGAGVLSGTVMVGE